MSRILEKFYSTNNDNKQVFAELLYGSQNYGLAVESSDVDTRVIYIPTLKDLVRNRVVSKTVSLPDGLADVKDIREMFTQLKKSNPTYFEILVTDYYYVNENYKEEFEALRKNATKIATYNKLRLTFATYGTATSKMKSLINNTNSRKEVIEKYGYDSKHAYHILRLEQFIIRILSGYNLKDSLNAKEYPNYKTILDIRNYKLSKEEALRLCEVSLERIKSFTQKEYKEVDQEVLEMLDDMAYRVIEKHLSATQKTY